MKSARQSKGAILLCLALLLGRASADKKFVTGTYQNRALGFSVLVPPGMKGVIGEEAGPQRGLRIPLRSGGEIVVFGEPNSLEWTSAAEGVRWELEHRKCALERSEPEFSQVRIGKLHGARGRLACGGQVVTMLLAFRSKGGPVYWIRLETSREHEIEDQAVLISIIRNFKLIRWQ